MCIHLVRFLRGVGPDKISSLAFRLDRAEIRGYTNDHYPSFRRGFYGQVDALYVLLVDSCLLCNRMNTLPYYASTHFGTGLLNVVRKFLHHNRRNVAGPITSGSFFQLTHHCTQEMLSVLEGSNNLYTVLPGPQYNLKLFIIVSHAFHRNIFWCARIS